MLCRVVASCDDGVVALDVSSLRPNRMSVIYQERVLVEPVDSRVQMIETRDMVSLYPLKTIAFTRILFNCCL